MNDQQPAPYIRTSIPPEELEGVADLMAGRGVPDEWVFGIRKDGRPEPVYWGDSRSRCFRSRLSWGRQTLGDRLRAAAARGDAE